MEKNKNLLENNEILILCIFVEISSKERLAKSVSIIL